MAKRLKTRLSAGAALVTGLGMIGLATAVPANAATDLVYSCTTPLGAKTFDVSLDATTSTTAVVGDTVTIAPTGKLTLSSDVSNAMAGFMGWHYVEGDANDVPADVSNGTDTATVATNLVIARTHIWDGSAWIQDDTPELPISGTGGDVTVEQVGEYTVSAPTTFDATFRGYDAEQQLKGGPIESTCTYVSGSKTIDSITVTAEPDPEPTTSEPTTSEPTTSEPTTSEPTTSEPTTSEPTTSEPTTSEPTVEANDWFTEPSSLPITDDEKHFTIEGTATQAGTIDVVLLDGDKNVLRTITWDVTEGSNTRDFPFAEGTDYVRIVSQDCVDADGNDGSVAGGCNVEYYAPWVNPDSDTETSDGGSNTGGPETPGVVQTDGFTRVQEPAGNNAAAFLIGGALLAGAGAGSVLIARRRQGAQH